MWNVAVTITVQEPRKGLLSEQSTGKVKTRTTTGLAELINSARLLCEQANQATGKNSRTCWRVVVARVCIPFSPASCHGSVGDYPMTDIGSKDGQYRILSLDGGGLRAVMEAVILMRLVEVSFTWTQPVVGQFSWGPPLSGVPGPAAKVRPHCWCLRWFDGGRGSRHRCVHSGRPGGLCA